MHGGDIYRNKIDLDFSVNINPLGIPDIIRAAWQDILEDCGAYPDIRQDALKRAMQDMTGVSVEHIICGNGASELLPASVLAACNPDKKVLIPVPSFSGYERAVRAAGLQPVYYRNKRENDFAPDHGLLDAVTDDMGMVILANPGNPVGNLTDHVLLEKLLRKCLEKNIYVLLDECFMDFVKNGGKHSYIKRTEEYPNLMVVRTLTKILALPGIRLGYMVCGDSALQSGIELHLPEWNISAPAVRAGILAPEMKDYFDKTQKYIESERSYLRQMLTDTGCAVYPGAVNYLFFYSEYGLYDELLKRGILIRNCDDYRGLDRGYYRVAVRKRVENDRLIRAMREIVCG